ncbi:MAG TPA: ECF-type sigma factor [Planctomycetota bacterium]|nr:ECF-type sigma factor [Planctomycetota bacterium]
MVTPERGQRAHEAQSGDDLFAAAATDLHDIAARLLRGERSDHTLQPTALLHEAWLRLGEVRKPWLDRNHFVRAAAGTMRRILVDHARAKLSDKRNAGGERITLAPELLESRDGRSDLLAVDEVLQRMADIDEELVRIVELRVFGGLSHAEIADAIGTSLRSVERGWRLARAWLRRELEADDAG